MKLFGGFNLRDKGAAIWAGWNRTTRTIFVIAMVAVAVLGGGPVLGHVSILLSWDRDVGGTHSGMAFFSAVAGRAVPVCTR